MGYIENLLDTFLAGQSPPEPEPPETHGGYPPGLWKLQQQLTELGINPLGYNTPIIVEAETSPIQSMHNYHTITGRNGPSQGSVYGYARGPMVGDDATSVHGPRVATPGLWLHELAHASYMDKSPAEQAAINELASRELRPAVVGSYIGTPASRYEEFARYKDPHHIVTALVEQLFKSLKDGESISDELRGFFNDLYSWRK